MIESFLSNFWLIQIIGIVALGFLLWSFQGETKYKILHRQIISSVIFVLHFLLLGAYTGASTNAVIVLRNYVFERKDSSSWAKSIFWLYFFLLISIFILAFTWQGYISILPVLGIIIGTFARWRDKPSLIRILSLTSAFLWIPYSLFVHSYAGVITQLVIILFIIFAMNKLDRKGVH